MKVLWVCLILGVAGLPCLAAETISTYSFGSEGVLWDFESGYWTDNTSVSWTQTLDGLDNGCEITKATLTIDGCGIDNVWWDFDGDGGYEKTDYVDIWFGSEHLGQMSGNSETFELSAVNLDDLSGDATITFREDGGRCIDFDWVDSVYLKSATLSVTYNPVAVPVPGALVLAGLGTVLVGALRRRKNA